MSYTTVILPLIAALNCADTSFLDTQQNSIWQPINQYQEILVNSYLPQTNELTYISPHELISLASRNITEVNQFLSTHNMRIQLTPERAHADTFYIASVLRVAFHWPVKARECHINFQDITYPAFLIKQYYSVMQPTNGSNPVAVLKTNEGDFVYLTQAPQELRDFTLLASIAQNSIQDMQDITDQYDGVIIPMVDLTDMPDMGWLRELSKQSSNDGQIYYLSQALQQTNFQMNENGAAAQSAVALAAVRRGLGPSRDKCLIFDKPFCLWIRRPGMTVPLFAAYIDPRDWKQPLVVGQSSEITDSWPDRRRRRDGSIYK
jgi:hypothetical protein